MGKDDKEPSLQKDGSASMTRLRSVRLSAKDSLIDASERGQSGQSKDEQVLDVKKLDRHQSKRLLEHVLETHDAQREHSVLLDRVRERLEAVGLKPPSVEVRFEGLTVETNTVVASRQIPSLFKAVGGGMFAPKDEKAKKTRLALLAPCSGVLRPGRLCLVLGPPGSGRTTFLKALAGRAQQQAELTVSGSVTYNGKPLDSFVPARAAAYVSQADLHYGELTVRETLAFSARCQGAGFQRELLQIIMEREDAAGIVPDPEVDAFMKASAWSGSNTVGVELTLKLLGLESCADTVVGNAMLRGISGGEKKRTTSGEALVGPARVLLADEISTGLDSRTTYDLVKYLRGWVRALNGTAALALLQPSPETYELFDDIILLSSGVVVYSGPREAVLPFFSELGLECPPRCGVAEFLQEITTATDQQKYNVDKDGQKYVTAQAMAKALKGTSFAAEEAALLRKPFTCDSDDRMCTLPLPTETYGASYSVMWMANLVRSWSLQQRRSLFLYVRWFQVALMALVVATLYIKLRSKSTIDDGNTLLGALFFSMIYMLMAGSAELHVLGERLPVFYRQREMKLYPGSAFALPAFLFRLPYCLIDAVLWSCIMYWAVGMAPEAGRFFMFIFLMFLTAVWATSLYQALASIVHMSIAQSVSSFMVMLFVVSGGFVVTKGTINEPWYAVLLVNPWFYLTQAMSINEFTSSSWGGINPADPSGPPLGIAVLEFRGFKTNYYWVWIGVAIVLGSTAINVAVFVLAATFKRPPPRRGFITQDALAELECNRNDTAPPPSMVQDIAMGSRRMAKTMSFGFLPAAGEEKSNERNDNLQQMSPVPAKPGGTNGKKGAGMSFEPLVLTWMDVGYSVPVPKGTRADDPRVATVGPHAGQLQLLHHVSGAARPGVLTALMGASGAGKTTLMDVLAGRKTGGVISGEVRVNGHAKDDKSFARVSAYVEQEDCHLSEATVGEAIAFSASLRLPTTVADEDRDAFIEEVMSLVELQRLQNVCIGRVGGTGLTIEQRKRLTIAVELVSNPSILFMDEPTTGLDARGAAVVMAAVRATAGTGRTVVATIHQPSYAIFEVFDELLLLKPGGRCIYAGPLGPEASDLVSYFSSISGVRPIKPRFNPANWMLEETAPMREADLGIDFAEIYEASKLREAQAATVAELHAPAPGSVPLAMRDMHVRPLTVQFVILMRRLFQMYWRLPQYTLVRGAVTVLVSFVFGTVFWNKGQDYSGPATVLNIAGVLFMSVLFVGVTNALTVQGIIEEERRVFYRERAAGTYSALPFAIAQSLVELPFLIVQSIIYVFPTYAMIGFRMSATPLGYFFLYFTLTLWYFTEYGGACVNLTPEMPIAVLLTSFLFSFYNLFSGFMIPASLMGWWWRWVVYVNPVAWSLEGLLVSQLGDLTSTMITDFQGNTVSIATFMDDRFGYNYSMLGPIVAILIGFILFFRAVSAFALTHFNFQKR